MSIWRLIMLHISFNWCLWSTLFDGWSDKHLPTAKHMCKLNLVFNWKPVVSDFRFPLFIKANTFVWGFFYGKILILSLFFDQRSDYNINFFHFFYLMVPTNDSMKFKTLTLDFRFCHIYYLFIIIINTCYWMIVPWWWCMGWCMMMRWCVPQSRRQTTIQKAKIFGCTATFTMILIRILIIV